MYGIPKMPTTTIPIIHAPFMMADRGQWQSTMQAPSHQNVEYMLAVEQMQVYPKESSHIPSHLIELFELEVGESEVSDLR